MDLEDGRLYIRHLSQYIRAHEKALANTSLRRRNSSQGSLGPPPSSHSAGASTDRPSTVQATSSSSGSSSNPFAALGFAFSSAAPPSKLYLTPNQLYFLLSRFEELGVTVGPMDVRLENIGLDSTPSNYVSFLTNIKRPKHRNPDQDSLHSVSSVRSAVSSMASLWSNLGMGSTPEQKEEKRAALERDDLRYLYSAMTKIPALKFALDHRIRRIKGYEEFPFDSAVPLWAFKNLSVLEVVDLDFRSFFGWDRLAEQLRSLTLKRAGVDDLADLLTNIVLDDTDRRRRRSAKSPASPVVALASPTPASSRKLELARTTSSSLEDAHRSLGVRDWSAGENPYLPPTRPATQQRLFSGSSPGNYGWPSQQKPAPQHMSPGKYRQPRRSSSSASSEVKQTPQASTINLLPSSMQPPTLKWRFLRHLSLADNSLTSIPAHGIAPLKDTLQSLDLSANLFTEIPDSLSTLVALRALNLSGCMIDSLNSLSRNPLPAITVLNLRSNRLRSLAGIDKLYSLERLDLRCNSLTDPAELARLTGMPEFHDVYVVKNPFTKTHSNYRLQIFNLFRKTPGYTEDVSIDSSGPGYSERKYLVDRVPERAAVPVVKPPTEDEVQGEAMETPVKTLSIHLREEESSAAPTTPPSPTATPTARSKRKGARRRVVDLSAGEVSPKSLEPQFVSPEADEFAATPLQGPSSSTGPAAQDDANASLQPSTAQLVDSKLTTPTSPVAPLTPTESSESAGHAVRPDMGLSGEEYRRRTEALKKEYGHNWPTALHLDGSSNPFYPEQATASP